MKLSQAKLLAKVIPYYDKLFKDVNSYVHLNPDALFCWISNRGDIYESKSTVCYAALSTNQYGDNLLAVGARLLYDLKRHFVAVKNIYVSKEEIENYITYVIERSPFKDAFLNKQAKSVLKHKWMFMDVSQPANYMVSALVAIRYTHEFPNLIKAWNELVKVGINEDLAWLIIHICHYNPAEQRSVNFYAHVYGHTVISSSLPLDQAQNFLNRKFVHAKPPYIKAPNYRGFDALWSKKFTFDYPYGLGSVGRDVLSIISKSVVGSKGSSNPFAASNSNSGVVSVPLEEFPEFILKIQDKIMEEVNNA